MTVGELLAILKITKQSLARVLGQLMREGFVVQRTEPGDRRRRRLLSDAPRRRRWSARLTERQARAHRRRLGGRRRRRGFTASARCCGR